MAQIFIVLTNTTINHRGVQVWVVLCVWRTPQYIINVGFYPRFLQTELDHSLIGLWGRFQPHGQHSPLKKTPRRYKRREGPGLRLQTHLVKPILQMEDGPNGVFGLLQKKFFNDRERTSLIRDLQIEVAVVND